MPFILVPEYADTNPLGACVVCRVERREGVRIVDFGIDIDVATDQDGQPVVRNSPAQVCDVCLAEVAHLLGWQTDHVTAQLQEMRQVIGSLQSQLKGYRELQRSIDALPVRG